MKLRIRCRSANVPSCLTAVPSRVQMLIRVSERLKQMSKSRWIFSNQITRTTYSIYKEPYMSLLAPPPPGSCYSNMYTYRYGSILSPTWKRVKVKIVSSACEGCQQQLSATTSNHRLPVGGKGSYLRATSCPSSMVSVSKLLGNYSRTPTIYRFYDARHIDKTFP